jgi:hypothetical protein
MRTASNTTVTDNFKLIANRFGDRCNAINWRWRCLKLPPSVIGQHHGGRASVDGFLCIFGRLQAFND